jgi:hypothetical protein
MPVGLSSVEEVSSEWINLSNPGTALFDGSEFVVGLSVSSAVSVSVDSSIPFVP